MRRVGFLPAHEAEVAHPEGRLLISLNYPGETADVEQWDDRLILHFDDIDTPVAGLVMFSIDDALKIIGAIDSSEKDVVVHCTAGLSRSAGVTRWLLDHRNFEYMSLPGSNETLRFFNRHVFRTLNAADGGDMATYYTNLEREMRMMGIDYE